MAKRLTAKAVENIKPRATRVEVPDGGCRGLFLICQPSGRRSWCVRYRYRAKSRKLTLTGFPSLASARQQAAEALRELEQGRDPAASKFEAARLAARADAERRRDTVEQLVELFFDRHVRKHLRASSRRQVEHIFQDIVLPAWQGRIIHDVKRRDIIDLVESVAGSRPVMANRTLAALSKFFNWLVARDVIAATPCGGVSRPAKERARERVLAAEEIKALWATCESIGGPGASCMRMLLLTGQRRGEVSGMRRSEIDGDLWKLSAARTKNARAHTVPLSRQAMVLVEAMPQINGSDFVFTTSGSTALSHFDRVKCEIDARMKPTTPWVTHDLRRTVATNLQKLKIPREVIEATLNHAGPARSGVVGVYQQYDFIDERREALQRWADQLDHIVTGKPADVITLARRR